MIVIVAIIAHIKANIGASIKEKINHPSGFEVDSPKGIRSLKKR